MFGVVRSKYILILSAIFIAMFFIGLSAAWHHKAGAMPLAGGRSIITEICNDGFTIIVGPPRPGYFKVQDFFTAIYLFYQFEGTWVLGDSIPGGECCIVGTKICHPVEGTLFIVGTSLY